MIKIMRFLKPYSFAIVIILILAFAQAMSNLYLPTLMADIVDKGIINADLDYIWRVGGLMTLVAIGGTICAIIGTFISSQVAVGFGKIVRHEIFYRVEQFSLQELDKFGTASLITRTINDTNQVQQVLVMALSTIIVAPMLCIGGIVMAIQQDRVLTWILVVIVPVLIGIIVLLMYLAVPLFRSMQTKLDKLNLILKEGLAGVRVVRAFDRVKSEERRFDVANIDLTDVSIRVNRIMALTMPLMMLVMNVSGVVIIWFGGLRVDNGDIQIGALMAFWQYAMQILFSLMMVSVLFTMIPRASASAMRINEVLATQPEINDPPKVKVARGQRGLVEFQEVTFNYQGAEEPVLSNITFTARLGQVTAIIGGTGAGKTTLISLIPRFYDISHGKILVNGVDVREMSQANLRAKIGFVPQKAFLFSGTISENLRYGKEDASEEEIRCAAEVAQASEFISAMPDGFESIIAQGGTNVSGGQKQRLSIARALVRKPEIYIFDDSFSALDFKTDARLRQALRKETLNATILVVAQRVSTVMDADQIIVLDKGRIVGIGTHKQLLKMCDVYYEIVSSQLSMEEIA